MRKRKKAELVQIINWPTALVDEPGFAHRLPGFTRNHLRTADERVVVDLAKEEVNRRNARKWLVITISAAVWAAVLAAAYPLTVAGGAADIALLAGASRNFLTTPGGY